MPIDDTVAAPAEPPEPETSDEPPPRLRVGVTYNLKRVTPGFDGSNDEEAEYDSESTVRAICDALVTLGHDVVCVEADRHFFRRIEEADVDLVFNIAEGVRGRARESMVPAVLDTLGIPYSGSDAATMALTLDKALAKAVVSQAGVPVARSQVMRRADEPLDPSLRFPLFAKPVAEGSSKGVTGASVVHDESSLRDTVATMAKRYAQGVLVEEFLPGREFTVAVLEHPHRDTLPAMEVVFAPSAGPFPVYSFAHKQAFTDEVRYDVPAQVDDALAAEIRDVVLKSFVALGCRDVARIDVRIGADQRVHFIECNPLPGLTPEWSDLCIIAKAAGIDYVDLIARIVAPAIDRALANPRRTQ